MRRLAEVEARGDQSGFGRAAVQSRQRAGAGSGQGLSEVRGHGLHGGLAAQGDSQEGSQLYWPRGCWVGATGSWWGHRQGRVWRPEGLGCVGKVEAGRGLEV